MVPFLGNVRNRQIHREKVAQRPSGAGDEEGQLLGTEFTNLTFCPSEFLKIFLGVQRDYFFPEGLPISPARFMTYPFPPLVLTSLPSEGQSPLCESPRAAGTKFCKLCGLKRQDISPSWFQTPEI